MSDDRSIRNPTADLAMLVVRLVRSLKRYEPDAQLIKQSLGFLERYELVPGSILRDETNATQKDVKE